MQFKDFENFHRDDTIIVCGLGESVSLLDNPDSRITIGVNDIGRLFHPTYLLNVNNVSQYKGDRFSYVESTQAKFLFTHDPPQQFGVKIPIVKFEIQRERGGVEIVNGKVPHYLNTPYMGVVLAAYMGASRIGLIGVDFTDNHFWIKDGPHRLTSELQAINVQYGKLCSHLWGKGIGFYNLSPDSRITSIPKMRLEDFETPLEHRFDRLVGS
jgi:hypothetical protein